MSSHLTNGICCSHFSFYLLWEYLPGVFGNSQFNHFSYAHCLICVCLSLWACHNSSTLTTRWPHRNSHKHKHKHTITYLTKCTSPHKQKQDLWPQAHALWGCGKCQLIKRITINLLSGGVLGIILETGLIPNVYRYQMAHLEILDRWWRLPPTSLYYQLWVKSLSSYCADSEFCSYIHPPHRMNH